jgi:hypothetical protein
MAICGSYMVGTFDAQGVPTVLEPNLAGGQFRSLLLGGVSRWEDVQ